MENETVKNKTVAFRPNKKLFDRLQKELQYPIYNGRMSNVLTYILTKGIDAIDGEFQKDKWQADVAQSLRAGK